MREVMELDEPLTLLQGQFLPYHRLFVRGHEHALQTECGYKGAQP